MKYSTVFKFNGILLIVILIHVSCSKGPGTGGRATIWGKVYARNFSNSFFQTDSGYIGNQKVFIKYGDEIGVSDDVDTDNSGTYSFPYLRPGKYTIFTYSKVLKNNQIDSAVVQEVEINSPKENIELPQFNIFTLKN